MSGRPLSFLPQTLRETDLRRKASLQFLDVSLPQPLLLKAKKYLFLFSGRPAQSQAKGLDKVLC